MQAKKLGFGCMRLPLKVPKIQTSVDKKQVCEMVDSFIENGFTYFDTAYMYHAFKSESAMRECLVKRHPRDSFTLADKLPTMMIKFQGEQERIFESQLKKCGVEYFDYYLLHCLNESNYKACKKYSSFEYTAKKKEQGIIKKLGFSFHDNAELLDKILTEHPEMDFVQLQINYLDWNSEKIQSRLCYEVARKHGKDIVVMEPVKGGALANVPAEAEKLFRQYNPDASPASWAVRYAASLDGVMMVLSGMSNMQQLQDNMSYMKDLKPLNNEEYHIINEAVRIINKSISIPCTACHYCTDECPQNIEIPKYFELFNSSDADNAAKQYKELNAEFGKASDCIGCKSCERHCPQHLEITKYLKDVANKFEQEV